MFTAIASFIMGTTMGAGAEAMAERAKRALRENGKSLLAKGILSITGAFNRGDVVSIHDKNDVEFARGLAKVGSNELKTIAGVVVHRDDLVIL